MKMSGDALVRPMLMIFAMVGVYIFLFYAGGIIPGSNWDTIREGLLQFLPWLIVLVGAMSVAYEVAK